MSKQKQGNTLDNLVSEYIEYENVNININKECEVKFGTKGHFRISKYDFENVILKLQNNGFKTDNINGSNLLRIMCDKDGCHDDKIKNIRLELNGDHTVQEYCKNENLLTLLSNYSNYTNLIKKFYPKKNGKKYIPYDNNEFGFRLTFQLEENLLEDDEVIRINLLQNYNNIPKFYRYINRVEFINPDFPFKCHLSIVKQSKTTAQTIKRSGVLNNNVNYEIEIEFDNDKIQLLEKNIVLSKLRTVIKYILCGLQDTKYPVSYKELNTIKQSYLKMFGIQSTIDDIKPKDFIGYSTKTLKILNIQGNSLSNDITINTNYTVTEKADGARKLLYIHSNGHIYLIDTQLNVQFTGMYTTINNIYNSILDGEHIKFNKKNNYINTFAAFDIYMLDNEDKRIEPFIEIIEGKKVGRLALLEKVVKSIKMKPIQNVPENAFVLKAKQFYSDEGKTIFDNCNIILQKEKDGIYDYNIDGLVFTPNNQTIPISNRKITWDYSFKWKPPKYNTVDFLIKIYKENGKEFTGYSPIKERYKTVHLYVGFSGGYVDPLNDVLNYNNKIFISEYNKNKKEKEINKYKPVLFLPSNPYDEKAYVCNIPLTYGTDGSLEMFTEENELITDNTIVEFSYDKNEKIENFQWKPLRIRYDKTQQLRDGNPQFGNDYTTANNNWNSIHYPITEKMIRTGLEIPEEIEDDVYYNTKNDAKKSTPGLRDFHNLVVKKLLIDIVSNKDDTLMDFAVGKGGDLPKWIKSDLSFIYGIDIMRDNIENKKNGACARFLNYSLREKKIPYCIFTTGDSGKNIRSGDALIDDKNRMINDAVFGKGSRDKLKMGYNLFQNYGIGENGFNITSCQFAIHYFFENKYKLENFISNIIECTKLNGYFIGTSYDGNKLFNLLKPLEKGESKILRDENGNIMWELTKQYDRSEFNNDGTCLSYPIDVYQESINKTFTEWLVNYEYFNELMNIYGFVLVEEEEIKSKGLLNSSGLFSDLYTFIDDNNKTNIKYNNNKLGQTLNMTENEKYISFLNRYFIYKKIRKYTGDVNIMDANVEEVMQEYLPESPDYPPPKKESNEGMLYDPESKTHVEVPGTPDYPPPKKESDEKTQIIQPPPVEEKKKRGRPRKKGIPAKVYDML